MSATVRTGETGIDSSFSHPPPARLVELGYTFRVGYISVPPASPGKNITDQECTDTLNAGMKLNLVFEINATRATLGAPFGTLDGLAAKQEALLRGQPTDVPIIMADDTSTTVANLPKKVAYMQAADAAAKPFDIGIYGGVKILQATLGLWKIGWVPISAWSWSVNLTKLPGETTAQYNARGRAAARQAAIDVGAHVLQGPGFYIDGVWAVDPNEAIADFPAWGLTADPPIPPPGGDDMATVTFEVTGLPGIYMWTPGSDPVPFTDVPNYQNLSAGLAATQLGEPLSKDMYDRLFATPITVNVPPIVIPPVSVTFPSSATSTSKTKWSTP